MTISFTATSTAPGATRADVLAVPAFTERVLGAGGDAVQAGFEGKLDAFLARAGFDGKAGESVFVPLSGPAGSALLVGLGDPAEVTTDGLRRAGAVVARRAKDAARVATTLADAAADGVDRAAAAQAVVEGVLLGSYSFDEYRSKPTDTKLAKVSLVGDQAAALRRGAARAETVAAAVLWARDMVNTPAAQQSPDTFAKAAQKLLRGRDVRVEVLDVPALRRARLGGILGVGQGSKQPPRLVKMTYAPRGARGSVALVGKGVVFDSGGLSIKTGSGMETMKTDMAGAAAVIATMSALSGLGVKTKVVAFTPMVENMPSGEAIRPGDVLTFRNRKTAEVLNTDAEGRLILADALSLAAEAKPDVILDLATLTGACVVALGEKIAGVMGNDEGLSDRVIAASKRSGEPMWPLPLPKEYRKMLDSEIADMKNISHGGYGGALTAGLFLQEFVDEVPWAHLDIAGPARAGADDGPTRRRGGTGFGVRTLLELLTEAPPRSRQALTSGEDDDRRAFRGPVVEVLGGPQVLPDATGAEWCAELRLGLDLGSVRSDRDRVEADVGGASPREADEVRQPKLGMRLGLAHLQLAEHVVRARRGTAPPPTHRERRVHVVGLVHQPDALARVAVDDPTAGPGCVRRRAGLGVDRRPCGRGGGRRLGSLGCGRHRRGRDRGHALIGADHGCVGRRGTRADGDGEHDCTHRTGADGDQSQARVPSTPGLRAHHHGLPTGPGLPGTRWVHRPRAVETSARRGTHHRPMRSQRARTRGVNEMTALSGW